MQQIPNVQHPSGQEKFTALHIQSPKTPEHKLMAFTAKDTHTILVTQLDVQLAEMG
jgi:hypothetical protein